MKRIKNYISLSMLSILSIVCAMGVIRSEAQASYYYKDQLKNIRWSDQIVKENTFIIGDRSTPQRYSIVEYRSHNNKLEARALTVENKRVQPTKNSFTANLVETYSPAAIERHREDVYLATTFDASKPKGQVKPIVEFGSPVKQGRDTNSFASYTNLNTLSDNSKKYEGLAEASRSKSSMPAPTSQRLSVVNPSVAAVETSSATITSTPVTSLTTAMNQPSMDNNRALDAYRKELEQGLSARRSSLDAQGTYLENELNNLGNQSSGASAQKRLVQDKRAMLDDELTKITNQQVSYRGQVADTDLLLREYRATLNSTLEDYHSYLQGGTPEPNNKELKRLYDQLTEQETQLKGTQWEDIGAELKSKKEALSEEYNVARGKMLQQQQKGETITYKSIESSAGNEMLAEKVIKFNKLEEDTLTKIDNEPNLNKKKKLIEDELARLDRNQKGNPKQRQGEALKALNANPSIENQKAYKEVARTQSYHEYLQRADSSVADAIAQRQAGGNQQVIANIKPRGGVKNIQETIKLDAGTSLNDALARQQIDLTADQLARLKKGEKVTITLEIKTSGDKSPRPQSYESIKGKYQGRAGLPEQATGATYTVSKSEKFANETIVLQLKGDNTLAMSSSVPRETATTQQRVIGSGVTESTRKSTTRVFDPAGYELMTTAPLSPTSRAQGGGRLGLPNNPIDGWNPAIAQKVEVDNNAMVLVEDKNAGVLKDKYKIESYTYDSGSHMYKRNESGSSITFKKLEEAQAYMGAVDIIERASNPGHSAEIKVSVGGGEYQTTSKIKNTLTSPFISPSNARDALKSELGIDPSILSPNDQLTLRLQQKGHDHYEMIAFRGNEALGKKTFNKRGELAETLSVLAPYADASTIQSLKANPQALKRAIDDYTAITHGAITLNTENGIVYIRKNTNNTYGLKNVAGDDILQSADSRGLTDWLGNNNPTAIDGKPIIETPDILQSADKPAVYTQRYSKKPVRNVQLQTGKNGALQKYSASAVDNGKYVIKITEGGIAQGQHGKTYTREEVIRELSRLQIRSELEKTGRVSYFEEKSGSPAREHFLVKKDGKIKDYVGENGVKEYNSLEALRINLEKQDITGITALRYDNNLKWQLEDTLKNEAIAEVAIDFQTPIGRVTITGERKGKDIVYTLNERGRGGVITRLEAIESYNIIDPNLEMKVKLKEGSELTQRMQLFTKYYTGNELQQKLVEESRNLLYEATVTGQAQAPQSTRSETQQLIMSKTRERQRGGEIIITQQGGTATGEKTTVMPPRVTKKYNAANQDVIINALEQGNTVRYRKQEKSQGKSIVSEYTAKQYEGGRIIEQRRVLVDGVEVGEKTDKPYNNINEYRVKTKERNIQNVALEVREQPTVSQIRVKTPEPITARARGSEVIGIQPREVSMVATSQVPVRTTSPVVPSPTPPPSPMPAVKYNEGEIVELLSNPIRLDKSKDIALIQYNKHIRDDRANLLHGRGFGKSSPKTYGYPVKKGGVVYAHDLALLGFQDKGNINRGNVGEAYTTGVFGAHTTIQKVSTLKTPVVISEKELKLLEKAGLNTEGQRKALEKKVLRNNIRDERVSFEAVDTLAGKRLKADTVTWYALGGTKEEGIYRTIGIAKDGKGQYYVVGMTENVRLDNYNVQKLGIKITDIDPMPAVVSSPSVKGNISGSTVKLKTIQDEKIRKKTAEAMKSILSAEDATALAIQSHTMNVAHVSSPRRTDISTTAIAQQPSSRSTMVPAGRRQESGVVQSAVYSGRTSPAASLASTASSSSIGHKAPAIPASQHTRTQSRSGIGCLRNVLPMNSAHMSASLNAMGRIHVVSTDCPPLTDIGQQPQSRPNTPDTTTAQPPARQATTSGTTETTQGVYNVQQGNKKETIDEIISPPVPKSNKARNRGILVGVGGAIIGAVITAVLTTSLKKKTSDAIGGAGPGDSGVCNCLDGQGNIISCNYDPTQPPPEGLCLDDTPTIMQARREEQNVLAMNTHSANATYGASAIHTKQQVRASYGMGNDTLASYDTIEQGQSSFTTTGNTLSVLGTSVVALAPNNVVKVDMGYRKTLGIAESNQDGDGQYMAIGNRYAFNENTGLKTSIANYSTTTAGIRRMENNSLTYNDTSKGTVAQMMHYTTHKVAENTSISTMVGAEVGLYQKDAMQEKGDRAYALSLSKQNTTQAIAHVGLEFNKSIGEKHRMGFAGSIGYLVSEQGTDRLAWDSDGNRLSIDTKSTTPWQTSMQAEYQYSLQHNMQLGLSAQYMYQETHNATVYMKLKYAF